MNKKQIKLNILQDLKEQVRFRIEQLGSVMDDYDGGQKAAYDQVLKDVDVIMTIVDHAHPDQQEPGMDY